MFQAEVVKKIKTHILCSIIPPPTWKLCHLWDNVEKYGRTSQATHDKVMLHIKICLACQTT